ncbi:MAG: hypothetical protein PUG00_00765 [Clostridiales bacterium]|nr:hypothetical protein [Clostridiales bacterium]
MAIGAGYIDYRGFSNYYLQKSKYAKKQALLKDFSTAWYKDTGDFIHITVGLAYDIGRVWSPARKKRIKTVLIGYGHTAAAVTGLFKAFDEWNKAQR